MNTLDYCNLLFVFIDGVSIIIHDVVNMSPISGVHPTKVVFFARKPGDFLLLFTVILSKTLTLSNILYYFFSIDVNSSVFPTSNTISTISLETVVYLGGDLSVGVIVLDGVKTFLPLLNV